MGDAADPRQRSQAQMFLNNQVCIGYSRPATAARRAHGGGSDRTSRGVPREPACGLAPQGRGFPPRFAGASLKREGQRDGGLLDGGFPPRFAGASLKPVSPPLAVVDVVVFSPAFCGGLIEARTCGERICSSRCFPAFCGGLIEAIWTWQRGARTWPFSPAFAGASLKRGDRPRRRDRRQRFPPRFAGASLKPAVPHRYLGLLGRFSPAFCGGLIEAVSRHPSSGARAKFSPAFCGGLIEAGTRTSDRRCRCGFSPAFCGGLEGAATRLVAGDEFSPGGPGRFPC